MTIGSFIELVKSERESNSRGFRVWYGDWSTVTWLDEATQVQSDSLYLAENPPLSAPSEIVANSTKRLCVWSDEDPDGDHSDEIASFADYMRSNTFIAITHVQLEQSTGTPESTPLRRGRNTGTHLDLRPRLSP